MIKNSSLETQFEQFSVHLTPEKHPNFGIPTLQLLAPSSNQILILHCPNEDSRFPYTLIQLHSKTEVEVTKTGLLPCLLQDCSIFSRDIIVGLGSFTQKNLNENYDQGDFEFLDQKNNQGKKRPVQCNKQLNHLIFFDIKSERMVGLLQFPLSEVYNQRCLYSLFRDSSLKQSLPLIIFYKISDFKSYNEKQSMLNYEINLFNSKKPQKEDNLTFNRLKRYKEEFASHRSLIVFQGQIVSIELSGYAIEVYFLETKQKFVINSVYSLLLIDVFARNTQLMDKKKNSHSNQLSLLTSKYCQLHFSYDELQPDQVLSYAVDLSGITKMGKKMRQQRLNQVHLGTENRIASYQTFLEQKTALNGTFSSRKNIQNQKQGIKIGIKIRLQQQTKFLFLLEQKFGGLPVEFLETVVQLLKP